MHFPILAVTCPDLSPLINGAIVYSDPTIPRGEDSTVTYSCDTGYGLTGDATLTCTYSGWDGTASSCTGMYCLYHMQVINSFKMHAIDIHCSTLSLQNGNITYSNGSVEDWYYHGTTATYQCDSGYKLTGGDTVRTCTGDGSGPVGQWNGTAPACLGKGHTDKG